MKHERNDLPGSGHRHLSKCPPQFRSGFQTTVDSFILSTASEDIGGGSIDLDVSLALMPEDSFQADNFQEVIH